ncbi:TetR/AcrR family transcriptional regulator [Actinoplanes couchii]|uniref:Transcriptional regulator n=1 Tax=Actinoplanes couchii TaxID=403638 RepID=A0ABQ3X3P6_9ACTN|nr:TetR/AcrR family transcriptional regulator [Actinoplanes couchii]MDR6322897.1 AcrR family transcriptional regulator [Actinoplanes couchii]GID53137.1 transcriptional regulator [Actinoplanes couchii]
MEEPVDTATAILASAAVLLRERSFDDISYRALADEVGISERTIYRQYPTRAHLLAALATWIEQTCFPLPPFVTVSDFCAAVHERFRAFDAQPAYAFVGARASAISPTLDPEPAYITRAIEAMLDVAAPTLNRRDRRRVATALCYFSSAMFWARLRTGFDLDAAEICDAFDRAAGPVLAKLPATTRSRPTTARETPNPPVTAWAEP